MIWHPAPATLPPGRRLYAIGDVHGCADRLRALHDAVRDDLRERPCAEATLVHLGDLIDRGPDSAGCLEAARGFGACPAVHLLGNHEDTALLAIGGEGYACADWLETGGREALRSWGITDLSRRANWAAAVPADAREFMGAMALFHQAGPYLFVHAGIRPGVALKRQGRDDLLRIRRVFLDSEADHGCVVVHGHTPTRDRLPEIRANRVNLDTGCVYEGGRLTLAVFEDARIGIRQA